MQWIAESAGWQAKLIDFLAAVFQFLIGRAPSSPTWGWILAVLIVVALPAAAFFLILSALRGVFEAFAKVLNAYKDSGLPVTINRSKRIKVRHRAQFCSVLRADLATLAKAENWNDQYFTDLEAEVETEGGYYPSALSRWFGRRAHGLRRVPSLMGAIASSSERAILLVGEPGSGKSVALRHLANQLASRAVRSKDPKTVIPLYVNLREMPAGSSEGVSADDIRRFVLENIRRGDADTSAYVRDNWAEYREQGIWLFLFDSFDEIPDVLHAPSGSPVIRQFADAIRQFIDGIGSCRGVLASREFKGPDTLPWPKFRILPLNEERQAELVDNSFLDSYQSDIVHQHLATNTTLVANNPLFLSLLCRFVKDEKHAPANDHDLLIKHIERLAYREPEYTQKKYALTPEQLLDGAESLAVAFAVNSTLSLAPTQDEISAQLDPRNVPAAGLANLLFALVDVKIARSDVAGDRRFAFSHRRYQETLFVRHLARDPNFLTARELLTNLRWREYTVSLLQTEQAELIQPLLSEAAHLLRTRASAQTPTPVRTEIGHNLSYYEWDCDTVIPVLELVQEGLSRRSRSAPAEYCEAVSAFLRPRWTNGDHLDRRNVIKYGGLLPLEFLVETLAYAFQNGTPEMQALAFQQAVFPAEIPEKLSARIRRKLADQTFLSRSRRETLRLRALAARLPGRLGANLVIRRCLLLERLLRPFRGIDRTVFRPAIYVSLFLSPPRESVILENLGRTFGEGFIALLLSDILVLLGLLVTLDRSRLHPNDLLLLIAHSTPFRLLALVYLLVTLPIGIVFALRTEGHQLDLRYVIYCLRRDGKDAFSALGVF